MTTNTTNSQAASINNDPEFGKILRHWREVSATSVSLREYASIVEFVDAKLAQAREEGVKEAQGALSANDDFYNRWIDEQNRADTNEGMAESMRMFRQDMIAAGAIGESIPPMFMTEAILGVIGKEKVRAIAAESRLAEIQRGVEGLSIPYEVSAFRVAPRKAVWLDEVLALLQPQGQADTSGLPG